MPATRAALPRARRFLRSRQALELAGEQHASSTKRFASITLIARRVWRETPSPRSASTNANYRSGTLRSGHTPGVSSAAGRGRFVETRRVTRLRQELARLGSQQRHPAG
jgi:hypothetical protein